MTTTDMTTREKDLLTSADSRGKIPFPQGSAEMVERAFRWIKHLEDLGLVVYEHRDGQLSYWLTSWGWAAQSALSAVEELAGHSTDNATIPPGGDVVVAFGRRNVAW